MSSAAKQLVEMKYTSDEYIACNPSYHEEDSEYKALLVADLLRRHAINPASVCDIGCGTGKVLAALRPVYPAAELYGYDIAPNAARFWGQYEEAKIHFRVGDFLALNDRHYDVVLLLDVLEHLANPGELLTGLRDTAQFFVFHLPLDLSAFSVTREQSLLHVRQTVGHIHYFTKELALTLLREYAYEVISWRYTGASYASPNRTWKSILKSLPARLAGSTKDWWVRLLGGETLIVLARSRSNLS